MNRFVEPQEVASVMLSLCSSEASAMTGQAINVTGGFHHDVSPSFDRRPCAFRSPKEVDNKDRACTS
jgi:hypothetical protein